MLKQEQFTTLERKIERFTRMLEERPKDGLTVLALAEASFRRGLKLDALTAYQQVTKEQPVSEAYLAVAEIYSQQNMTSEAYGELRRLFELDPENVEARLLANELQAQSPAPDDVAQLLNEPTSDEAFDEARLRLQIQRAIHNRELQERTRNVTLEPGVVIHEYYVEEAKKKLIDVDEQLRKIEDLRIYNATLRELPRPEAIAPEPELEASLETETEAESVAAVDMSAVGDEAPASVEESENVIPVSAEPVGDFAASPVAEEMVQPEVVPVETASLDFSSQEQPATEQPAASVPDFSEAALPEVGEVQPMEPAVPSAEEVSPAVDPALSPVEDSATDVDPTVADFDSSPAPAAEVAPVPPAETTVTEALDFAPESTGGVEPSNEAPEPVPVAFDPPDFSADSQGEAALEEVTPAPIEITTEPEPVSALDTGMELVTNVEPDLPDPDEAVTEPEIAALPDLPAVPDFSDSPTEPEMPTPEVIEIGLEQPSAPATSDVGESYSAESLDFSPEPVAPVPDALEPISVDSGIEPDLPEPSLPELVEQAPEVISAPELPPVPAPEPMPIQMGEPVQISEPEVAQPAITIEPEAAAEPEAPAEPAAPVEPEIAPQPEIEMEPEPAASNGALAAERQAFYVSQAEELGKLTATLARTRGVTSIFLCSRDGTTIDSVVKDDVTEARIGELVLESFDFLTAYAESPAYWVLECGGGIFVMQALDDFHVLIAIGQAGANFGALRYTMDKTKAKFGAILKDVPR